MLLLATSWAALCLCLLSARPPAPGPPRPCSSRLPQAMEVLVEDHLLPLRIQFPHWAQSLGKRQCFLEYYLYR